ncbi:DinB family protein [Spirosoma horti]
MDQYLNELEEKRNSLIEKTKNLSLEHYNFIPPGFNNNIIWNLGHMLAVSESILYKNSNFLPPAHAFDITRFKRGTKPEQSYTAEEITSIRQALLDTVTYFKKQAAAELTVAEAQVDGSSNVINGAVLQFLLFHENLHYRTIGNLLKTNR